MSRAPQLGLNLGAPDAERCLEELYRIIDAAHESVHGRPIQSRRPGDPIELAIEQRELIAELCDAEIKALAPACCLPAVDGDYSARNYAITRKSALVSLQSLMRGYS